MTLGYIGVKTNVTNMMLGYFDIRTNVTNVMLINVPWRTMHC